MYFDWCLELVVRTDFGHNSHPDHKSISQMACKAEQEGRSCSRRGKCVVCRDNNGNLVTSKTFGGNNANSSE